MPRCEQCIKPQGAIQRTDREEREKEESRRRPCSARVAVKLSGTSLGGPPEHLVFGGVVNWSIRRGMVA
jgi:hypothetical protein